MDSIPLINRLLSGIVVFNLKGVCVQVKPATVEDKTLADFYAQEVYNESLLDCSLTQSDVEDMLLQGGWWTKEEDKSVETMNKNLEQMKLDYYINFFKTDTREYIKKAIDTLDDKINKLFVKKYEFFNREILLFIR